MKLTVDRLCELCGVEIVFIPHIGSGRLTCLESNPWSPVPGSMTPPLLFTVEEGEAVPVRNRIVTGYACHTTRPGHEHLRRTA